MSLGGPTNPLPGVGKLRNPPTPNPTSPIYSNDSTIQGTLGVALAQVRSNIIHTHKKKVRRTILAVWGTFYRVGVAKNGFFLPLRGGWGGGNDSKIFANRCFFKTRLGIYSQKFYQPICFGSPQGVRAVGGYLKGRVNPFQTGDV